ncbi:putative nucleotide-sugar transporter YMD8 [Cyberlindnera fabianii]|uniref:GDP-mannose transporter n=1 Tax=Cyberlindnera fabianii TaxID=36022 RepID=A0A1V2L1P0_CYBFA|nr:putative nucleotide-sugar transporter YMD8 [Cyberlindnera fabianii]
MTDSRMLKLNSSQTDIHRRPSIMSPVDPPILTSDSATNPLISRDNANDDGNDVFDSDNKVSTPFITETSIQIIICIAGLEIPNLSNFYLTHIIPCSLASAGDIGFGNVSFRYITLTTYTMVKSSSIAFVLLFGVLAKLEKFTYNLLGIVLLMSVGVMLMVDTGKGSDDGKSDNSGTFLLGFTLVLLSACMSGLRWVFTQLLLVKNHDADKQASVVLNEEDEEEDGKSITKKKNPIYTIYQLSPPMFVTLFIIGCFIEGLGSFINAEIWTERGIIKTFILLLFPGFLVFFMTLFEFGILQRAHVITLSIAGIFKELLTILASTFIFHDTLTMMNGVGLVITLIDILLGITITDIRRRLKNNKR